MNSILIFQFVNIQALWIIPVNDLKFFDKGMEGNLKVHFNCLDAFEYSKCHFNCQMDIKKKEDSHLYTLFGS